MKVEGASSKWSVGNSIELLVFLLLATSIVYCLLVDRYILKCFEISFLSQGIVFAAVLASTVLMAVKFLLNIRSSRTKTVWASIFLVLIFAFFVLDDYGYGGPNCNIAEGVGVMENESAL